MKKMSDPVVFFGSGPVAAESLRLLAQDFEIEAIVTKPRAPHHKGDVPVLNVAAELQLPVYTVSTKKELDALITTQPFKSQIGVLIDFGIIVSQQVIDYFPLGIVNSHFSILPEWRGADPITFAVLSGQQQTGVSLMLLVAAMDEGPLLAYGEQDLWDNVTTPQLTAQLIKLSHGLLRDVLPRYVAGELKGVSQTVTKCTTSYSRKLTKEDGLLDWSKPAAQLEREIRAYIEWPKSRSRFSDIDVVITSAHVIDAAGKPGSRTILNKQPVVFCGEQALAIDRLKPAGKKEMTGQAFLAGYSKIFRET
jgi:methionyl-tRNA formyltransferase